MHFIIDDKRIANNSTSYQKFRSFCKPNTDKFHAALATSDWTPIFNCSDPNVALNLFIDKFTLIHDSSFPFVNVKTKTQINKKWITPSLLKSINLKCKLYKKWIKTKKSSDEIKYKNHAKLLKKNLNYAEKQFYSKQFDTKVLGSKTIWQNINSLISIKKVVNSNIPQIITNGITIDQPLHMANAFNDYFSDVGNLLSNTVPPNPPSCPFENFLGPANPHSFYCSSVSYTELLNTVSNLKPSKSLVNDCVSPLY